MFSRTAVYNCHSISNRAADFGGGVLNNAIVYYNAGADIASTGGTVHFSCVPQVLPGQDNVTNAPLFVARARGDYRLTADSFCINAGAHQGWMSTAHDLAGTNRILYGVVDMGAYEMPLDLWCSFTATVTQLMLHEPTQFRAVVAGSNAVGLYYRGDFDHDGVIETQGALGVVTYAYPTAGVFSVGLSVSNARGSVATRMHGAYLTVLPEPRPGVAVLLVVIGAIRMAITRHRAKQGTAYA